MKKIIFAIITITTFVACGEISDRLDYLEDKLGNVEKTQIASLNQQIASINNSINLLNVTDKELRVYITSLEVEAKVLEKKLVEINTKIDAIKDQIPTLGGDAAELANLLAELELLKASVNGELVAINCAVEDLKAKDIELNEKIETLQEYLDSRFNKTAEWASATFVTLEQYNTIVEIIANIEGIITGVNENIASLEERLEEKIAKDIESASVNLSADFKKSIEEIIGDYTAAIATAKDEIIKIFTEKLELAINSLETSMKDWVNEQLTFYSTIADTEAKITILQNEVDQKLAAQKTYLETLLNALPDGSVVDVTAIQNQIREINETISKNEDDIEDLRDDLSEQKTDLTEAYTIAIAEAIKSAKGVMREEVAAQIKTINERIDNFNVDAIATLVNNLNERLNNAEEEISQLKIDVLKLQTTVANIQEITKKLVGQIQSISYIPRYSDGKASIDKSKKIGLFDFQISPKNTLVDLGKVWQSALSFKAVHTQTRAVSFIELPIIYFDADVSNGTFTIEVDATNLGQQFFSGDIEASAALHISDGNNDRISEYVNLTLGTAESILKSNEIWYASTTGDLITPNRKDAFSAKIKSNSYSDGKGIIVFDGDITIIGNSSFSKCSNLKSIMIPKCVKMIDAYAFSNCSSLTNVNIPEGVTSIAGAAFWRCTSLVSITIPNSVTEIATSAFEGCSGEIVINNKELVERDYPSSMQSHWLFASNFTSVVVGKNSTKIGTRAFFNCKSAIKLTIHNNVTTIGDYAFFNCSGLSIVTLSNNLTSIGAYAFEDCSKIKSITIPASVTSIGEGAFCGCSNLKSVYCAPRTPPTATHTYSYWDAFNKNIDGFKIYVPRESVEEYKAAKCWKDYAEYIEGYDFE